MTGRPKLRLAVINTLALAPIAFVLSGCAAIDLIRGRDIPPGIKQGTDGLRTNDRTRAIKQFDSEIAAHPTDFTTYAVIASQCLQYQQFDLAAKYALQGSEKVPADPARMRVQLYTLAATSYSRLGDTNRMIAVSKQAHQAAPNEPGALNLLGYSYAEVGTNLNEAIDLITRAIRIAKEANAEPIEIGMYVDSLGWAYFKLHRNKEAIDNLSSAADLIPNSAEVQYHLAVAYRAAGRDADARVCLLRARALQPGDPLITRELREVDESLARKNSKPPSNSESTAEADR